jgi:hypothetical protein
MLASRCCKHDVWAMVDYYVCSRCHFPCAIVLLSHDNIKDYSHESRHESQAENSFT